MGNSEKKLYIVIGCDTDPDRPDFIGYIPSGKLSWRGLKEGIPATKENVRNIKDENGRSPVFTWLIRADEQINYIYGDYGWALNEFRPLLIEFVNSGDEIGWHPHFYKYNDLHKIWYQELHDLDWQRVMLESAYRSFARAFPGSPQSVRMGWIFHNNETMKKLDELGIKIDFSAVPGLRTNLKRNAKFPYNIYDWYIAPKSFYHPSASDYRKPPEKKEDRLAILEVPNFVSNSLFWGLISGLQLARKMKDPIQIVQALRKPTFWVNLTATPKLFSSIVRTLEKELRKTEKSNIFFITYFHPDELIENKSSIYRQDYLKRNLIGISEACIRLNIPFRFIKAGNIPEIVSG